MDKISFDKFQAVDIRIGTVKKADVPEWSHWVIRMEIDFGEEIGIKKAFSGIMKFFTPAQLIGKQFPFVVNLEPKKIGPDKEMSEAMMIMATPTALQSGGQAVPDEEDEPARNASSIADAGGETPTVLFKLQKKVPNGTKVR